jgi:hypothetical protein
MIRLKEVVLGWTQKMSLNVRTTRSSYCDQIGVLSCGHFVQVYTMRSYYWNISFCSNMVKSVIYLLFSYQTGYRMWHSRLKIYIPFGCASGNIEWKYCLYIYINILHAFNTVLLYVIQLSDRVYNVTFPA